MKRLRIIFIAIISLMAFDAEAWYGISPYAYCAGNPINLVDLDGKQPTKYVDSNGNKQITWSIIVMVKAPKVGASTEQLAKHETYKQSLVENYTQQFDHFLNGDGLGALNSSGERVFSTFNIHVVDVSDPSDNKTASALSNEYRQNIKDGQAPKHGLAAVFMEGSTEGHLGLNKGGTKITISNMAPEGTESHELFHNSGIGDNGYQNGGILNSPPQPISPAEVDELWETIPEQR